MYIVQGEITTCTHRGRLHRAYSDAYTKFHLYITSALEAQGKDARIGEVGLGSRLELMQHSLCIHASGADQNEISK